MRASLREDAAKRLGELIARAGLKAILALEERDPQLLAVRRVAEAAGTGTAAVTASLVALASYRLAMRGEEWWSCYGDYFSSKTPGFLEEAFELTLSFIDECRGAAIQRDAKRRRVEEAYRGARGALAALYKSPWRVLDSGSWLLDAYARALMQEPWRKTLAFSVKMAYYAARSLSRDPPPAPWDVPIPVDLRVSCVTYTSGLVEAQSWSEIFKYPKVAVKAWRIVAEWSRVPPLNIDSLLWMIGSIPRGGDLSAVWEAATRRLQPVLGEYAGVLVRGLLARPCR